MSKLPTCCEFYNVDCNQRRNCPADAAIRFAAETEGVMSMATGCSVKAVPDPARQPLPVFDKPRSIRPTLKWFAVLIVSTALSAPCAQHGIRFFN